MLTYIFILLEPIALFFNADLQNDVSKRSKLSTIEAKIQSFIPGKLVVVSITPLQAMIVHFAQRSEEA